MRFLQLDHLVRNMAVVGALVLVLIAVRNSSMPEAQSVFGVLQQTAGMQWDESVGKLSFVNSLLPEAVQEVWNETQAPALYMPASGDVIHAWSRSEPYLLIRGEEQEVLAAEAGEVMNIAHGLGEERILRIRHNDHTETFYGNLSSCLVEVGDHVEPGTVIGSLLKDMPLAFEVRVDGRSVEPAMSALPFAE